jgi:hypothetical protein
MSGDAQMASDRLEGMPKREFIAASLTLVAVLLDSLAAKTGMDPLALLDGVVTEMMDAGGNGA